jgi:hypothetical protein
LVFVVPGNAQITISAFFNFLVEKLFFEFESINEYLQLNTFIYLAISWFIEPFPKNKIFLSFNISNLALIGSPIHFFFFLTK